MLSLSMGIRPMPRDMHIGPAAQHYRTPERTTDRRLSNGALFRAP